MQFDIRSIKAQARAAMGDAHPRPWQITLAFLMLTVLLPNLLYEIFGAGLASLILITLESASSGGAILDSILIGLFVTLVATLVSMIVQLGYSMWALRCWRREEENGYTTLFEGFSSVGRILLANVFVTIYTMGWLMLLSTAASSILFSFAAGGDSPLFYLLLCLYLISFCVALTLIVLRYSMVPFVLIDRPELSAFRAVALATAMVRGQIWKLFRLYFSFLGLFLLANILSIGASFLVVHLASGQLIPNLTDPLTLMNLINEPLPYWLSLMVDALVALYLTPYVTVATAGFYNNLIAPPLAPQGTHNIDIY